MRRGATLRKSAFQRLSNSCDFTNFANPSGLTRRGGCRRWRHSMGIRVEARPNAPWTPMPASATIRRPEAASSGGIQGEFQKGFRRGSVAWAFRTRCGSPGFMRTWPRLKARHGRAEVQRPVGQGEREVGRRAVRAKGRKARRQGAADRERPRRCVRRRRRRSRKPRPPPSRRRCGGDGRGRAVW